MAKTIRSPLQNKQVPLHIKSLSESKYRPTRKFHYLKAIPVRQFKAQLTTTELLKDTNP